MKFQQKVVEFSLKVTYTIIVKNKKSLKNQWKIINDVN